MRQHVIVDGVGLDYARPANNRRHTIPAFPIGRLLAAERRRAAVRPTHDLGAVVGREDDDGVVGDAEIVELLEQLPDIAVELDHTVGIDAVAGLARDSGLRCVHTCMRVGLK